jgi:S1-C subfamily serine protease
VIDTLAAVGAGVATAAFVSYDVDPNCDDSSPFSGCFKTENARTGVSVLFGTGAAVLAASAIYGFVQTSSCSENRQRDGNAAVVEQPPDVLPMSCVAAARLRAEDRFHNSAKTQATIFAEGNCVRDQAATQQQWWHASQDVQMERIEWDHYGELRNAAQSMSREPPPQPAAPASADPTTQPRPSTDPETISFGSCFFVSPDGIVVTNRHVIEGAKTITVIDATNVKHEATVLRSSEEKDLAVLDVPSAAHHAALAIDGGASISLGQHVFTIGFPLPTSLGFDPKFSDGAVAGLKGLGLDWLLQTTIPIQPGNSGGAVVTDDGLVVAIVVAKLNAMRTLREAGQLPENVNFAIKSSALVPLLRGLRLLPSRKIASRTAAVDALNAAACQVIATTN